MPKKLTVLGALAAVVLGAVSLFGGGGTALAGPGGPVQDFDVDANICYGAGGDPAAFTNGAVCPPGTAGVATAGNAESYSIIDLDVGSRLTLPVTYTPNDFSIDLSDPDGATTGTVTALTDVFCDANFRDILAEPPHLGNHADWPNGWTPYDFIKGPKPAYLDDIKPTPANFTTIAHSLATLTDLKLEGGVTINLLATTGSNTPLSILIEQPVYYPGLRSSVAILGGQPSPPGGFLCLDSPQNSVAEDNNTGAPLVNGMYPRFTVFTSDVDHRAGTVSRIVDLQCVTVGPAQTDTDGDCIPDTSDLSAAADADGDGLVDGIELELGTNPAVADSDGDGANDFTELAQFTRPIEGGPGFAACGGAGAGNNNADDTDCDGQLDRPENGADEVPSSLNNINDTNIDDNCPGDANPLQENSDSPPYNTALTGTTPTDITDPTGDNQGDACDTDDDNDGIGDVPELGLHTDPLAPGGTFCKSAGAVGASPDPTNPLNADTDQDYALDGLECRYGSDPTLATSRFADVTGDNLAEEVFWRTEGINIPTGAPGTETQDLDGDGDSGTVDSDSDNDGLIDGTEVKYYGSEPSNDDSDSDGCQDGREAADINSNRQANIADLQQIAQAIGPLRTNPAGSGTVDLTRTNRDVAKAAAAQINVADVQVAASRQGNCVAAQGVTIVQTNTGTAP